MRLGGRVRRGSWIKKKLSVVGGEGGEKRKGNRMDEEYSKDEIAGVCVFEIRRQSRDKRKENAMTVEQQGRPAGKG